MTTSTWQSQLKNSIRQVSELVDLGIIAEVDAPHIESITSWFPFAVTPYYAKLINWQDPNDPLKKIVAPSLEELNRAGSLDVGGEAENTQDEGIQMKYPSTALLLPIPACFVYCRFCFRKRLFNPEVRGEEILKNIEDALVFLRNHPTINNVLITGGDPLVMKTSMLRYFLQELRKIEHVKILRFGTRGLVFLPQRVSTDPELVELLGEISQSDKRIYVINHFSHPRELTREVAEATDLLARAGVVLANQTPILKGVNDSAETLRILLNMLAEWGITPYYVFQTKFVEGNTHFRIPLHEVISIFSEATRGLNGLAKRAKLIMAHASGKIEILGMEEMRGKRQIFLKYHQARQADLMGRIFWSDLPDDAYWLEDLPDIDEKIGALRAKP